ncbi:MAG: hypothetical protein J3K34DRAFT_446156 [Monoraphidium minutum]|nr:MAG: hypothetical protein J3K34DRAFT_446156 [Monoraphidium minutum]
MRLPPSASPVELLPAAERLCGTSWARLSAEQGDVLNVERYCTWGPYASLLLAQGLRLGSNASRVVFGRGDVAWPLGAALVEAAQLPGFMPPEGGGGGRRWLWHLGGGGGGEGALRRRPVQALFVAALVLLGAWLVVAACPHGQAQSLGQGRAKQRPLSPGALPIHAVYSGGKGRGPGGMQRTEWQ